MGWSFEELMNTDMNAIHAGFRGKVKMLQAAFGGSDDKEKGKKKKPNANELKDFAANHNKVMKRR